MRTVLATRNVGLLRDIDTLFQALRSVKIPGELEPYRARVDALCRSLQQQVSRNLSDLGLAQDEIIEDVLSSTQQATLGMQVLSSRFASPILRASEEDRLCLRVIQWVHRAHAVTADVSAAFGDGGTGVWPFINFVPIYLVPCVEQRGLLFQPLLFHEFGHVLYAHHKREMDDLVGDLQRAITRHLIPLSQRNDVHEEQQVGERQVVVDVWYSWAQELFCDGAGLTVGGPAFLRAFSTHLSTMQRGDFHIPELDLRNSSHPVTWLRIRLLIARAREHGYSRIAEAVERDWETVARTMGVVEDYHGFYDPAMQATVVSTVNDMLTEAGPRSCTQSEAAGESWQAGNDSVVQLLNRAWRVHDEDPAAYAAWQTAAVAQLLA